MKVKKIRQTTTEDSIETAFVGLLLKNDIDQISIKEITERAKVNRATFYAHFQDKYQLFDAIIQNSIHERIRRVSSDEVGSPAEAGRVYFQLVFDYLQTIKEHCPYSYKTLLPKVRHEVIGELTKTITKRTDATLSNDKRIHIQLFARVIYDAAEIALMDSSLSYSQISEAMAETTSQWHLLGLGE